MFLELERELAMYGFHSGAALKTLFEDVDLDGNGTLDFGSPPRRPFSPPSSMPTRTPGECSSFYSFSPIRCNQARFSFNVDGLVPRTNSSAHQTGAEVDHT